MKIKIETKPAKQFEKHYGKYAYGASGKTNGYSIHLKSSIKKPKLRKETIRHELGHIFAETRKITQKLPASEKRRLLKEKFFKKSSEESGAYSGKARIQEIIAELYRFKKNPRFREVIRQKLIEKGYPRTNEIINKEMNKFNPAITGK